MYCNFFNNKKDIPNILFITIFVVIIFVVLFPKDAEGLSPSFQRQEIIDNEPSPDWKYSALTPISDCTIVKNYFLKNSVKFPDIEGISYFSDGNFLNATIWLSSPVEERPLSLIRFPYYAIMIGIIQPFDVNSKVNYQTSISWDAMNQTWIKRTEEFLGNNTHIIEEEHINYKKFSDNSGNKGKVNLSLELRKLNFPEKYFLVFPTFDVGLVRGNLCMAMDFIDRFILIPPDFGINTFPPILQIKQGEKKSFLLNLNSTKFIDANLYLDPVLPEGFTINFKPNPINITNSGVATSQLTMQVQNDVQPGPYTFPLYSNISLPITIDFSQFFQTYAQQLSTPIQNFTNNENDFEFINSSNNNLSGHNLNLTNRIQSETIYPQPSYITAIVMPYSLLNEGVSDFWHVYGGLISLIGGGFFAGLSALILDRFKNRPKTKFRKIDDYD